MAQSPRHLITTTFKITVVSRLSVDSDLKRSPDESFQATASSSVVRGGEAADVRDLLPPINMTPSRIRRDILFSSPLSMAGEVDCRRRSSSIVPGISSGPSASTRTWQPAGLPRLEEAVSAARTRRHRTPRRRRSRLLPPPSWSAAAKRCGRRPGPGRLTQAGLAHGWALQYVRRDVGRASGVANSQGERRRTDQRARAASDGGQTKVR